MKKRQKKWVSIWLTLLLLFSIATPVATAKQSSQPLDSNKLAAMKDRLLQQKNDFKDKKINKSIDTTSNETIKVIVEFNEEPTAVQEHRAKKQNLAIQSTKNQEKKKNERANFKAHLAKKSVNAKFGKSFEKVFNGMALEVKASDVPKLAEDPNVKTIYENSKLDAIPTLPAEKNVPYMHESAPFIGVDQLWNLGYEGEGKKIGVIDTGVDYNHPDLKDAYKGGYDFVDNDADPFEGYSATQQIDSTHGTHVSGTIAGRGTYENGGVRGIAPKADLYVYRVLGPNGGLDEWVIGGIEKAVEDGMDVINLSLGNSVNDPDQPTSRAVNNAMLAGVVTVVANGNSGNFGYSTVGSPGTAALAISVGASYPPIREAIFTAKASATEQEGKDYTLHWMMKWDPTPTVIDPLMADKEIVYVGFGMENDFEGKDLTGKIALVKRGKAYPDDANVRAQNAGAVAVIFFHEDGFNEYIDLRTPQQGALPMFDMRGDDGRELVEKMEGQEGNTFTFTAQDLDVYPGDELAGFSSKGPVYGSWDIKPDLVAPGVNIRSTVPSTDGNYEKAFERYSGTSMATPHIAGLSALLLEAHPEMNVFDVKTALMNTSKTIAPLEGDSYNVQQIGAGRVQAVSALDTPVLAQVHETASYTKEPLGEQAEEDVQHLTGALNFRLLKENEPVNKTITLKSSSEKEITYKVSYDLKFRYELGSEESTEEILVTITPDKQEITVPASGSAELNVAMLLPAGSSEGIYEGYVYLTPVSEDAKPLQIPFIGYNSQRFANPIEYMEADPKFLSLNGDGKDESTNLEYKYLYDMEVANMYVWSNLNGDIYGLVTEFDEEDLKKGIHTYNWDGSFTNFNTGEHEVVPSGYYSLLLETQDRYGKWNYYIRPYVVSNEPTEIMVDNETTDSTGQKAIVIKENKLHGMITSTAVEIYRDHYFPILYNYYGNMVAMEYELYDSNNILVSKEEIIPINDFETPEKHLEYTLKDIFPNGESRLVLRVKDKAGNVNEQSYHVNYLQDPGVGFSGENEVEVGKSYELILQTFQVKDMVGAEYLISYPSKALTLQKIEPVAGFPAITLQYEKVKTYKDETGTEYTTVKVVTDLRKNPKEHKKPKKDMVGVSGNIPTGKLIFKASDEVNDIGNYSIKANPSSYTTMNLEKKPLKGSEKAVEIFTQAGSITGVIKPEALLDGNGNIREDVIYNDKDGMVLKVYNTKNGYGSENSYQLGELEGYRGALIGHIKEDGSFKITGLNPKEKYDIVIDYSAHFSGVVRNVQAVIVENGKTVPGNVSIDFGILKAGDVYNEDSLAQKLDIYDVANIARKLGTKAVYGGYDSYDNYTYDVNKDGQISDKDLSYSIRNFDLKNSKQDGNVTLPPNDVPPNEDAPTIMLKTEKMSFKKGDLIPVTVELKNTQNIYALQYGFTYDLAVLQLVGEDGVEVNGGQLGEIFAGNSIVLKNKTVDNRIEFAASYKGDASTELKDTGVTMTYYFKVLDDSTSGTSLNWDRSVLKIFTDSFGYIMPQWQQATENLNVTIVK